MPRFVLAVAAVALLGFTQLGALARVLADIPVECLKDGTCFQSGTCHQFMKYHKHVDLSSPSGTCYRHGPDGSLYLEFDRPVFGITFEVVAKGIPSSVVGVFGSHDAIEPSLGPYDQRDPVVVVGWVPEKDASRVDGDPVVTHKPLWVIPSPVDRNSTTPETITFKVYLPLGPKKVHIKLADLQEEGEEVGNTGIHKITVELGEVLPPNAGVHTNSVALAERLASNLTAQSFLGAVGCFMPWGYDRGVGTIPFECPAHQDKDGLLCYDKCRKGYTGVAFVCWEQCGAGETDTGAFCFRDVSTTDKRGRPCGVDWFGTAWDPACCFGGYCDSGYTNNGCFCGRGGGSRAKDTYTRGVGDLLSCPKGKVKEAGLCYTPCKPGYSGFATTCFKDALVCPKDFPVACADQMTCSQDANGCTVTTGRLAAILTTAAGLAGSCTAIVLAAAAATLGLATPGLLGCAAAVVSVIVADTTAGLTLKICTDPALQG